MHETDKEVMIEISLTKKSLGKKLIKSNENNHNILNSLVQKIDKFLKIVTILEKSNVKKQLIHKKVHRMNQKFTQ